MEWLGYVLTGCFVIGNTVVMWVLNRKNAQDAKVIAEKTNLQSAVKTLSDGQMIILHDRIKYLGKGYMRDGCIQFDDREDLVQMHEIYHKLGGNGNLNSLMQEIMKLPLKHD